MFPRSDPASAPIPPGGAFCSFTKTSFSCPSDLSRVFDSSLPFQSTLIMGRVRTKTVKKASRSIIERYYTRLTLDFDTNKRVCEEIAVIPTKKLRNKIAGFTTHLMKRIEKGSVRGISIKLQEEERERRDNYVPEVSAVDVDVLEVDSDSYEMLKEMNMDKIPGLQQVQPNIPSYGRRP